MRTYVLVAMALIAGGCSSPRLVTPDGTWLEGEPIPIGVENATPGTLVTLTAERQPMWFDEPVRSVAVFRVDDTGRVDALADAPVAAPWRGFDHAGLFWTMRTADEGVAALASPEHVRIRADFDGDGIDDDVQQFVLALGSDAVVERPLPEDFPGAFLMAEPVAPGERLPVVIIFGGSEGNDYGARYLAPMLASRGYAAVGVPYVSGAALGGEHTIEGLPLDFKNIPLELVSRVMDWVDQQPDLDGERIGLNGASKGAEFVLSAGARIDGITAIVAVVPSDVVWVGFGPNIDRDLDSSFSWREEPLPYLPHPVQTDEEADRFYEESDQRWRIASQAARTIFADRLEAARIPVEDIGAALFVAGGESDWLWDSGGMAKNIKARRDAAGMETTIVVSGRAGHSISLSPHHPTEHRSAQAAADTFQTMLRFYAQHLHPSSD